MKTPWLAESGRCSSGMLEDEMMQSMAMENEFFELFNNAMYMAATVICLLPILIVFAVVQRYFIQGVERTGLVE